MMPVPVYDENLTVDQNLERLFQWAQSHEDKDSERHRKLMKSIDDLRAEDEKLREAMADRLFEFAGQLEELGKMVQETKNYSKYTAEHVEEALKRQAEKNKEQDEKIAGNKNLAERALGAAEKYGKPAFYVSIVAGVLGYLIDKFLVIHK